KIETAVENIFQNYLRDGQLDEANITLKDLRKIVRIFVLVLIGTFHTRLPYLEAITSDSSNEEKQTEVDIKNES
ncbi:MAG: phosphohydrolase, partial [Candidatus Atribacteria bacterium]|nr:phosphohydrolase [Candidatus Atribacteria bacterium]MCD6350399.1 phosphohydrolase [Candidatus Atribacteria bacterium]